MKLWTSWKLQTKLVLSFSFLFACSIISSGVFYYYNTVGEFKKQTLQLLDANSSQVSRSIELYIDDMEKLSLSVFNDPLVQAALSQDRQAGEAEQANLNQQVTSHLLNLSVSWPSVQGIYLYPKNDRSQTYYWSKRSPYVGYSIAQEPWYPAIESLSQSFMLWPTMTENTITNFLGEKVFSLVRPINQIPTGRRIGYMKMDMDVNVMKDLVSYKDYGETHDSSLFIVDDQGNVIYDDQGTWTGRVVGDLRIADWAAMHDGGTLSWRGNAYLYGVTKSDSTGWTTLIIKPQSSITGKLKNIRNTVSVIEFMILMLVILIAWLIARGVTRPLRTMIVTMRHVERGDFSVRTEQTDSRNEIGQLGKVFNKMLNSLEEMITQVYGAELREKDARLLALQAQINPHFLFNTLNILKSLGRKGATQEVVEVTESLAHLFRYSLYDWDRSVELREELNLIESYLRIQSYRFRDRFIYEQHIPDELLGARIVRLMIQPLVENAIVHGLEQRKVGGIISVRVREHEMKLEVIVSDNGVGMDPDIREQLTNKGTETSLHRANGQQEHMGIALLNIHKRLQLMYGHEYGVSVADTIGQGTTIILRLPLRFDERGRPQ